MKTLSIDIETYSSVDLAKCGVYKYTEATDFDILLFGYSADGNPVQVVDLASGETIPPEVIAALTNDDVTKWAFNAQFERICLSRWLRDHGGFENAYYSIPEDTVGNYLDPASWKCTMIWSAYMGLPLSLEGVGAVLGLGKQKLTEGKELIKYFCQPCAPTKANGGRTRNLPENAPDKWAAFKRYNIRDVEVEMSIQEKLAKFPVPEMVWEQYHLDQEINDRGVALDMELVHQAIVMDTRSRADLTAAMKKLTALDNPNSVQQMKQWLSDNGLEVDLPKVGAIDAGTWRRLIVIPFNAKIEGSSDIKNYADYLFNKAGGAILKWIMTGAKRVIEKDYHIVKPAVVDAAIQKYKDNNDWLSQFLDECCEVGSGLIAKSGEVYNAYRSYCMQVGDYIRSTTDFYTALECAGFERKRNKSARLILGLQLKSDFLD